MHWSKSFQKHWALKMPNVQVNFLSNIGLHSSQNRAPLTMTITNRLYASTAVDDAQLYACLHFKMSATCKMTSFTRDHQRWHCLIGQATYNFLLMTYNKYVSIVYYLIDIISHFFRACNCLWHWADILQFTTVRTRYVGQCESWWPPCWIQVAPSVQRGKVIDEVLKLQMVT